MSTATLTRLKPAKWRVLNALFDAGSGGINVSTLVASQGVGWGQLVDLSVTGLIAASLGSVPIDLAGLRASKGLIQVTATRVRLMPPGHRLVITDPANQVIMCLRWKSNYTARVRDCKAEGMADDALLFAMAAARLIEPCPVSGFAMSMEGFRRLPPDLRLRLTPKGRQYCPRRPT